MVKTVDWGVVLPSEYRGVDKTRRMGQDGLLAIGLAWQVDDDVGVAVPADFFDGVEFEPYPHGEGFF